MTAASNEVVAVIQADRDMVQAFHRLRLEKLMEAIKDEKAGARLGEDEGDAGDLVQAFARHRIAHSDPRPVAEGLREALQRAAEVMEWLADNQPDCFGWEPPYPSTAPTIKIEAEAARLALAAHSPAPMAGEGKYLVWSNEHKAWWGADHRGYTRFIERAGRYDRAEALKIAGTRGGGWRLNKGNPDEIAIPEEDAIEQYADITAAQAAAHPSTQEGSGRG